MIPRILRNLRPLFLSALLAPVPVRITLQSGQTFPARLIEKSDTSITYLRLAKDGSSLKGSASLTQLQSLKLPLPLELINLSTQAFGATSPLRRKKALEKGRYLYDLYLWHQAWPGKKPPPTLHYARLLINCGQPQKALPLLKSLPKNPETDFLKSLCLHKTNPESPEILPLLTNLPPNSLPPQSLPLYHYLMARQYEKTRPELALINYLAIPLLHPQDRHLGPAALLSATALSIKKQDLVSARRFAIQLTNDYEETFNRRHRHLALRWLSLSNTYTKTHLINRLTKELLP